MSSLEDSFSGSMFVSGRPLFAWVAKRILLALPVSKEYRNPKATTSSKDYKRETLCIQPYYILGIPIWELPKNSGGPDASSIQLSVDF